MAPGRLDALEPGERPVAIFYATWCPYCQAFLAALADADLDGNAVKVDISDPEDPAWDRYGIETIPTAVRFGRDGEIDRVEATAGEGLEVDVFAAFLKEG